MIKKKTNIIGPEGEEVTFEADALVEEQHNAAENFQHLNKELNDLRIRLPYPDVTPYSTGIDYEERSALQEQKRRNRPIWDQMDQIKPYCSAGSLYSGHVRFTQGGDRYFMESPELPTRAWTDNGRTVILVNVDDKNYKSVIDEWHYPDKNRSIAYSRNITMEDQEILDVDIILDRNDSMYANITDNYLRNALKRNKDKTGIHSIIQTIQKKQDAIRGLDWRKSFIVQGCAGSGKTMVLLHRLRYLIYNRDLYSEDYYFLVPSPGFKQYVKDIAAKFNISYDNIHSYQGYYQYLLGRKDAGRMAEASELVFSPAYLSRVYSGDFMRECYRSLFDTLADQTNGLIETCEENLNAILDREIDTIAATIDRTRTNTLDAIRSRTADAAAHMGIALAEYDQIPGLLDALTEVLDKQKALLKETEFDVSGVTIAPDDQRLTSDERLRQLDQEVADQEARTKKASIFTVMSHRKKLKLLTANRDAYYAELLARVTEEEKQIRAAEAAKLSVIFDGVTILDLEAMLSDARSTYEEARTTLTNAEDRLERIEEIVAVEYGTEITALNQMIEASAALEEQADALVRELAPANARLTDYIDLGTALYTGFAKHISGKKEVDAFREKFKLFAPRTERELLAYLNMLLFNTCRKKIRETFDIKICNLYKHYWYLSLYCHYLTHGDTAKARAYVCIDEAQDLSPAELELIRKVNTETDGRGIPTAPVMNIFGDVNQMITTHGVTDWNTLDFAGDVCTLDENFRNPNQIVDYCNENLPFRMEKIGVDMDEVTVYDTIAAAKQAIPAGATFIVKDEYAEKDLKAVVRDCQIYTVKAAKGLEFKQVFVVDRGMSDNEKYIAYTRSLAKLTVIHSLPVVANPHESLVVQGDDI